MGTDFANQSVLTKLLQLIPCITCVSGNLSDGHTPPASIFFCTAKYDYKKYSQSWEMSMYQYMIDYKLTHHILYNITSIARYIRIIHHLKLFHTHQFRIFFFFSPHFFFFLQILRYEADLADRQSHENNFCSVLKPSMRIFGIESRQPKTIKVLLPLNFVHDSSVDFKLISECTVFSLKSFRNSRKCEHFHSCFYLLAQVHGRSICNLSYFPFQPVDHN